MASKFLGGCGHFLSRRRVLALSVGSGLGLGLLSTCRLSPAPSPPVNDTSDSAFAWTQFAGTELSLLLDDHPWTTGIKPYLNEFEALTGIRLQVRIVPEPDYFQVMETVIRSQPAAADVFFLPMDSTAYRQWGDSLLLPLTPLIRNSRLTGPGYNLFDFPENFRLAAMYPPGSDTPQLFGIPATFEAYILFYNKQMVDRYLDGEVPKTMAELVQAATHINQIGQETFFGAVMRGVSADTIIDTVTGIVLDSWGSDPTSLPYNVWFDGDWQRPRCNDLRIIEGLTTYAQLMQAGPSTIKTMDWPEATQIFQAGKAAFYIDASLFGPSFEVAKTSAIAGNVGYSVLPRFHQKSLTGHWLWGLGIPQRSAQPQAAWLFIQWATSQTMEPKIAVVTGGAPRFSSWLTPSVYTEAMNIDYALAVQTAMQTSRPTAVLNPRWNQVAQAIADTIHTIYDGTDAPTAATQLQVKIRQIMAQFQRSE